MSIHSILRIKLSSFLPVKKNLRRCMTSLALLVIFAAVLAMLDGTGRAGRSNAGNSQYEPSRIPVLIANTTQETYSLWKSRGIHARVMVHVGRYLSMEDIDYKLWYRENMVSMPYPVSLESQLGHRNYLRVAGMNGIFRKLINVLPEERFKRLVEGQNIQENGPGQNIDAPFYGMQRIITRRMPESIDEPVLLHVDASYFSGLATKDIEELFRMIEDSSMQADIITLGLSLDNPDVNDVQRRSLMAFAEMIGGGRAPR